MIVVVGAGAAGCMAAIFAAEAGCEVLLLERTRDGGRKILISGGGRCNVLPSQLSPSQYFTASSPNSMRKLLLSWPLAEQRRFFEETLRIPLALETESGKLFPASNRARDVRDGLIDYASRAGVQIRYNSHVTAVVPHADGGSWQIRVADAAPVSAAAVVLATGGLSVPATGSDGTGLRLVQKLGHTIHDLYPALTPLVCDPPRHAALAGISLDVTLSAPRSKSGLSTHGGFLFTHKGYSGPSVLDISHLAVLSRMRGERESIQVQWTERDGASWESSLKSGGSMAVGSLLRKELPIRLSEALLREASVASNRSLSQLSREERARLVSVLARYELPWTSDEGYKKAEVTGGGVALAEIHPSTLESRARSGLFLCGEMLDAFGPIGGYNFAWAWATGRAAGIGAAIFAGK